MCTGSNFYGQGDGTSQDRAVMTQVVGLTSGRVRAMFDERDNRVKVAGPSTPVQILGLSAAPDVGDRLIVLDDEREARDIASKRLQLIREQTLHQRRHVTLADLSRRMALGEISNLNLVIKGDVGGSVEALSDALLKLSNDEVAVDIVHSGVGAITESDVMLAAASDAIIIGFQVRPVSGVRTIAEREEIEIIREFMPKPLSDDEMKTIIAGLVKDSGATCLKDMGKIMGQLKTGYAGRVDMGKAGAVVKAHLCS